MVAAETKAAVRQILASCLKVDQSPGILTEILTDFHYHNYSFCITRDFNVLKISTFLSIMKYVLEESVRSRLTMDSAFDEFKEQLLKHAVERPPWSVGIFSFNDVKAVMDYAHNTFFRHFKLYMYSFRTSCDVQIVLDEGFRGAASKPLALAPLLEIYEVEPHKQPEFAHLFKAAEADAAEQSRAAADELPSDKNSVIKRRVEEGIKQLKEKFERKLKEQDDKFKQMMEGVK